VLSVGLGQLPTATAYCLLLTAFRKGLGMAQTVIGVFDTHARAVQGVEELRAEGFPAGQISIFVPDPREVEGFADEVEVTLLEAGAVGVAAGGVLGGLSGWLIGLAAIAVPGAGALIAAGPVVGAIVGALSGASLGGFLGLLAGLGLPKHAAEEYSRLLEEGRTLVIVHSGDRYAIAEAALNRARPLGIHHHEEAIGAAGSAGDAGGGHGSRIELAAPDDTRTPADTAVAIEGQRTQSHEQRLDNADLRPADGSPTS
jgi:hypothetical protein